jgi:hypothetical protein
MVQRRLPRRITLAAVLAMAFGVRWLTLAGDPQYPFGRRDYRRVVRGMTRGEVEAVLGKPRAPSRDSLSLFELVEQEAPVDAFGSPEGKPEVWAGSQGHIIVYFDDWGPSARVLGKQRYRFYGRMSALPNGG